VDDLKVSLIQVDTAPVLKRFAARAKAARAHRKAQQSYHRWRQRRKKD